MKKLRLIITLFILITMLVSCASSPDTAVLESLKHQYPDAKIKKQGDIYGIVSENAIADYTNYELASDGGNGPVFSNLSELEDDLNLLTGIIFIGEKTGESKQYIPISAETQRVDGLFYTNSKVRVNKVFYGNISVGDEIIYHELYAVFGRDDGTTKTVCLETPVGDGEYLFVLVGTGEGKLYEGTCYSKIGVNFGASNLSGLERRFDGDKFIAGIRFVGDDVYEKYVIKNDTSLNKEFEAEKMLKYKKDFISDDAILENDDNTLLESMLAKYGEKNMANASK